MKFRKAIQAMVLFTLCAINCSPAESLRDPWLWPFAGGSIWNTPIGSEAVYVPAGFQAARHVDVDVELLYRVASNAPTRTVYMPKSWETRAGGTQVHGSVQINDDIVVPDARKGYTPNNCAALLMPDGRTLKNINPLCRPEAGGPVFGYYCRPDTDVQGDGIRGSHGGSGLSAIGGSIRLGELLGDNPIRHAIKVDVFCERYAYFGENRKGFRWPADRHDSYAAKGYKGANQAVVMGALLAIPPQVKLDGVPLKTAVGRKLFRVLQDYGAYIVDDSAWDCHYLCAEDGVRQEVEDKLGLKFGSGALYDDINLLFPLLQVVDNNGPDRIGGGGKSRAPLAPPMAALPAHPQPAHVTVKTDPAISEELPIKVANPSMTEGEKQPNNWTEKWVNSGKIIISRDTQTYKSAPAALAVESDGGAANAQAIQFIGASSGTSFRLTAWARASGKATALVGVQFYTEDWKGIECKVIGNAMSGADWQPVSGEVTLPGKTARLGILLMIQGDGKVWLDDVKVEPVAGVAGPERKSAKANVEAPPRPESAWSPGEGFYPDYPLAWRLVLMEQRDRARKGGINLLFLGDSLTQGWDKTIWKERFEPLGAVNFGVGGDGTPQLLYRIANGILDGIAPKVVVMMIGINNTWPGYQAADTIKGVEACVKAIQSKLPQTKILLLGVLPIFDKQDGVRKTIKAINEGIASLDDGKRVKFLDFGGKFVSVDGDRVAELYQKDRLHLTGKAYQIWADAMARPLQELME